MAASIWARYDEVLLPLSADIDILLTAVRDDASKTPAIIVSIIEKPFWRLLL